MAIRLILILCEGKTEEIYFSIINRHLRISNGFVEILDKQGQHKSLIKRCDQKRKDYAKNLGIDPTEIEVWAVCDKDSYKGGYQKLAAYACEKNVNLAFSDPQFETYLLQHFEFIKTKAKQEELELKLGSYIGEKYNKTDLQWFEDMIDEDPGKLDFAIKNSDQLNNHAKPPFLTVQELTKRLKQCKK